MTESVDINVPGVTVKKSACYFCHQNCGVLAYVKDGKVIEIEGDPDHVTNQGGLCCRGTTGLVFLDHPARVNHALKRAGNKGENKWVEIPYDQAISEIAAKLNQIKEESGAEAVATAGGTLRTDDWARRRFMNMFGSPNGFHNALLCWIPTFMVETAVSGWSPFETDLGNSRCIILWGVNPGASNMPGIRGYNDLRKKGLKVIVVDPRYSETAAHADIWLPIRPGSDTALALGMLNTVIYEGLYDKAFVEEWCEGFADLRKHVKPYTARWAGEKCWVDPELIREAARMYATNTPGNIQWGCTADQLGKNAGAGMHARAILRAICGNLDCPGGDLMPGPAQNYITDEELEANEMLPEEQKAKQIGSNKFKLTSWPGYQMIADTARATWGKAPTAEWMCEAHGPSVFKAIITGDPYQIRALICNATNPIASYGDSKMILEAYKRVEFMVTVDYWITPTALYSDYVLPAAGALERPIMHNNYGVTDSLVCSQRAMQPMYDRHTDYSFWRLLGLACGQPEEMWPWANEEEAFMHVIEPLGLGVSSYDEFVENIRYYYPPQEFYKYKKNGFCTRSGKVELKSSILERLGYPSLPTYIGPAENEEDNPEVAKEYPLVLTTGGGFMPFHHSEHFNNMAMRYIKHDPYFTINPIMAEKLGIEDGDWCWIETRRGRIKQRANVEPSVHERVIYAQRGWWRPERGPKGPDPFGCLESNVNVITSVDDEDCDPIGGSWANRGLLCKVYKVNESLNEATDLTWSIPGNSNVPGVTVMPSEQQLAYELIPYVPPQPDFEVPEGLVWDPESLTAWTEDHTLAYDPESGWLYNPETGVFYDLWYHFAYDAENEWLVDEATGKCYNMETYEEIKFYDKTPVDWKATPAAPTSLDEAAACADAAWLQGLNDSAPFDVPEGLIYDKNSGYAWTEDNSLYYDAEAKVLVDPNTQELYDVATRYKIDGESGYLVSPEGVYYDPQSGLMFDFDTNDLVDENGNHYPLPGTYDDGTFGLSALDPQYVADCNAQAPFEVPETLVYDPESGYAWDAAGQLYYDPESGWLINPDTNIYYDLVTRYAYDAENECLIDEETGLQYDCETREEILPVVKTPVDWKATPAAPTSLDEAEACASAAWLQGVNDSAPFDVPEGLIWDRASGYAWTTDYALYFDPYSGWLVNPDTQVNYDLQTGYAYDPETGALLDENTGDYYDYETLRKYMGKPVYLKSGEQFVIPYAPTQYTDDDAVMRIAKNNVAPFEVPEGLVYDNRGGYAWTEDNMYYYDPESGWLVDPDTNVYHDLVTRYAYDPSTETLMDESTGTYYDMTTLDPLPGVPVALKDGGQFVIPYAPTKYSYENMEYTAVPVNQADVPENLKDLVTANLDEVTIADLNAQAPFEVPEGLVYDPNSQQAWTIDHTLAYDAKSGWLYDPTTSVYYDVATRYAYDADNNALVDADGKMYDIETLKPIGQ